MSIAERGQGWVGRSIRRIDDPTLIAGRGRFTSDLPAAHRVRFVRSERAAGRIKKICVPQGAMVITAADVASIKQSLAPGSITSRSASRSGNRR
jgi:carbon-monoxide dehydrogenase large subunit